MFNLICGANQMIYLFYTEGWDFSRIISLASVQTSSIYKLWGPCK